MISEFKDRHARSRYSEIKAICWEHVNALNKILIMQITTKIDGLADLISVICMETTAILQVCSLTGD